MMDEDVACLYIDQMFAFVRRQHNQHNDYNLTLSAMLTTMAKMMMLLIPDDCTSPEEDRRIFKRHSEVIMAAILDCMEQQGTQLPDGRNIYLEFLDTGPYYEDHELN